MEDFFFKMSYLDETYLNNLLNVTFYNSCEWPTLMRTKIKYEQLKGLYNVYRGDELENIEFFPTNTGIYRGDVERDHEIQGRVNSYWTTVLRDTGKDDVNE